MIINKEVLGELLLAAGYGTVESIEKIELTSVYSPAPVARLKGGDLADFSITVEVEPVAKAKKMGSLS